MCLFAQNYSFRSALIRRQSMDRKDRISALTLKGLIPAALRPSEGEFMVSVLPRSDFLPLSSARSNLLLNRLAAADFQLVLPGLRTVELEYEAVLVAAGNKITSVYFPHSGVISLVVSLADGEMVEAAMLGRDSVFGASAALDGSTSITTAIVQQSGRASVLDVALLRSAAAASLPFRTILMRHEQALFAQAQQCAACNATHPVDFRMARWLLRMRDLCDSNSFLLTQDFLAQMLGVRRNSVSLVANSLQEAGFIKYRRGQMEITDTEGLIERSCECYSTVKEYYKKLMFED
jgi:CRP-like cAMP-binding protein